MIPSESNSKAEGFIRQMNWQHQPSGTDQIAVQVCPCCTNTNFKFYINVSGGDKDGLWNCMVCSRSGNLYQLKEQLGMSSSNMTSIHDAASSRSAPAPLPDFDYLHKRLVSDESYGDVLDYLIVERKFTLATIAKLKIGAESFRSTKGGLHPLSKSSSLLGAAKPLSITKPS